MSVRREKKTKYQRGSRTYGWGRVGQHRRSGTRGGRGHAGYHKHMWTWVVKYAPDWYGKRGFTRHPSIVPIPKTVNVGFLDEIADELVQKGVALKREDGKIEIDVTKIGFSKVLGRGKVTKPLVVKAVEVTEKAKEKIVAAGGEVIELRGE